MSGTLAILSPPSQAVSSSSVLTQPDLFVLHDYRDLENATNFSIKQRGSLELRKKPEI